MLGDTAPLRDFVEVKRRHGAFLLVDEAHTFGVFGSQGRGLAEAQGVEAEVDFVVGTFSKSLGAIGGFAASDHPALRRAALLRPSLHVHRLAEPCQRRLGARRPCAGSRPIRSCGRGSGRTRAACTRAWSALGLAAGLAGEPGDRRAAARRGDCGPRLEPAARAGRLRQPRPAARHPQQLLPAPRQRLRRARARADR